MVIHALGVHPQFSGKGYAKALVRKAIELAAENGMEAIRLDVLEGNTPAENLYQSFGFQYMATLQMITWRPRNFNYTENKKTAGGKASSALHGSPPGPYIGYDFHPS